ncbi:hypothetical protein OG920_44725 [Streptomyces europaeiscabiei]|uniref:hypothetical protein n=1 Tax=Streptomyces europaeiscabiei TaxID=146819 RepID=UPI0029B59402|nr:hypothetical protein [Streptomyces europaeiscabiei]MDX3587384.1 hypothetical protein [Streptomyces europaeiscabiei]MDX3615501.1 hypothetical protein [Streptomyces europaeiscabiei]WUD38786.1 hypothetical protein OG858_45455 [Streptomyces europaeiscabiei]
MKLVEIEAGVVDDDHPAVLTEALGAVGLAVVADVVGLPGRPIQQSLQTVGGAMPGELGESSGHRSQGQRGRCWRPWPRAGCCS